MKKLMRWLPLVALLGFLTIPWRVVVGQANTGFTKIGSVAFGTNSFTDNTPIAGQLTSYEITAVNSAGESGPSNVVSATTPLTSASHSNMLSWSPGTTGGAPTSYNIYALVVLPSNPPTGLSVVSK